MDRDVPVAASHHRAQAQTRARAPARTRARFHPQDFNLGGRLWAFIVASVSIALFWSAPVGAYVRTRTSDTFIPYFWLNPYQTLEVAQPPDTVGVSAQDLVGASTAALAAWSYPAIACSGVSLRLAPGVVASQDAGFDGHNRIVMRTGLWCRDPNATTPELMHCHDQNIVALTTVFNRSHPGFADDGEILEADIEVNAVNFLWAVIPDGLTSVRNYADKYDLASALTHEAGHFIGLAHDCVLPGDLPLVDDQGNPSPDCTMVPAAIQGQVLDDTMYPMLNLADVSARTLAADDMRAVCEIYPIPVIGGCVTAPSPRSRRVVPFVAAVALMALMVGMSRRRRSSKAPESPGSKRI